MKIVADANEKIVPGRPKGRTRYLTPIIEARSTIDRVREQQRAAMRDAYLAGCSLREIAEAAGMPEHGRALTKIRAMIAPDDRSDDDSG